jgi:hypothetical protein
MTLTRAALLAALLSAAPLAAQAPRPDPLYSLDPQSRRAIEAIIDSAAQAGLPSRPLMSKALEGIQKRADGRSIVRVVRGLHQNLRQAATLFPDADEHVITAAAEVLRVGVRPDELAQFRGTTRTRTPLAALTYLADLVSNRDVPRQEASSAFAHLWRDGASDADFHGLWERVGRDILSGVAPGLALQNRVREFPVRPPPVTDAAQVPRS